MRKRGSAFPLIDTGVMFSSLNYQNTSSRETIVRLPYAGEKRNIDVPSYQQNGTRYIPARPILVKTTKLVNRLRKIMLDYVIRIISDKDY